MKKLFLMEIMLLMFGAANAQIADVKTDNGAARIYHDGDHNPSYSLVIDRDCQLSGFNSKYVIITCPGVVRIYQDKEWNASYSISLDAGNYVKNVTPTAILIKSPGSTRYYDFKGNIDRSVAD